MTDKVQKIREQANIDIHNLHHAQEEGIITEFGKGRLEALEGIVDFIDSFQEEPVSEDLEKEISHQWMFQPKDSEGYVEISKNDYTNIARHFANWQKEKILKESEDAIQYVRENHSPSEVSDFQNAMNIAVMKAFDAGKEKIKEQMMKDAIDAEVLENYDGKVIKYDETILDEKLSDCKVFDNVKVIVIKKE